MVQVRGSLVRAVYTSLESMGRGEQKTSLSDRAVLHFPTVSLVEHVHREPSESEDDMVKFIVLWNTPEDPVTFEGHYREVHIPLVKQLPGLRRYTIGHHAAELRGGEPYYWIAELEWNNIDDLQNAFQSPQGQATAQEVENLARNTGTGFRSMAYEVEEVQECIRRHRRPLLCLPSLFGKEFLDRRSRRSRSFKRAFAESTSITAGWNWFMIVAGKAAEPVFVVSVLSVSVTHHSLWFISHRNSMWWYSLPSSSYWTSAA